MNELQVLIENKSLKNISDVFSNDDIMNDILKKIEQEAMSITPDTSTTKGRKEIASIAYKISRSKTALDDAGKLLVSDWKKKAKNVDKSRREARSFLDTLRDKVRDPLTKWEDEEKERLEQERIRKEIEQAYIEAIKINELFDREKELEAKERIAAEKAEKLEQERQAKIEAEEKIKREQQLKEQAALKAKQKAEQEAQAKIDEAKRLEAEAKANAERLEREAIEAKIEAKLKAEQAEQEKKEAAERARIEKEKAVYEAELKAKYEAEQKENERIRVEQEEKRIAAEKAADLKHRRQVNNKAVDSFISNNLDAALAKKVVTMIAKGKIEDITINY